MVDGNLNHATAWPKLLAPWQQAYHWRFFPCRQMGNCASMYLYTKGFGNLLILIPVHFQDCDVWIVRTKLTQLQV